MHIDAYFKYDEVRAALGVTLSELPDARLGLDMYGEELYQELVVISGTLAPDTEERSLDGHYTYLKALETRTVNQEKLKSYIRSYAIYVIASAVAGNLSLSAPKTISDGRALRTRFSAESTFKDVVKEVYGRRNDLKSKIQTLLGITTTARTYVSVVAPAIDVITNEAYEE